MKWDYFLVGLVKDDLKSSFHRAQNSSLFADRAKQCALLTSGKSKCTLERPSRQHAGPKNKYWSKEQPGRMLTRVP